MPVAGIRGRQASRTSGGGNVLSHPYSLARIRQRAIEIADQKRVTHAELPAMTDQVQGGVGKLGGGAATRLG